MISNPKWICRDLTKADEKIFKALDSLKFLSDCKDKQVVCIIVDKENTILSVGINTILVCDQNCTDHEKRVCNVVHAEMMAFFNLSVRAKEYADRAYVNLFPCEHCQAALTNIVREVVVKGKQHKPAGIKNLVVFEELI